jgi:amidohydrolase
MIMSTLAAPAASGIDARTLRDAIARELPDLINIRRDLHAHPEIGYEEQRTSDVVQRELTKAGVEFRANLAGGTGVFGHIRGSNSAAAIGLRADMDALPILETSGVPYASRFVGKMHACGHDGHTTILIGAARVLSRLAQQSPLPRAVSFVFQPAAVGGAGAAKMIDDGCLDGSLLGPPIDHMFGLHGWPRLPLGVVGTRHGPLLAASDRFEIIVRGVGSHAAFPHAARDPIVAACAIVSGLQTIAARNLDPLDSLVVSVTMLHAGTAFNVIPPEATISGTARWLLPQTLQLAQKRLKEIAEGVAAGYGCSAQLDYRLNYPVTLNHSDMVEVFNAVARQTLGEQRVIDIPQPVMGGEDFSFYSQKVPSCFFVLGLIPPGKQSMPDLHQPDFNFNDDAIATGVEVFCRLALRQA